MSLEARRYFALLGLMLLVGACLPAGWCRALERAECRVPGEAAAVARWSAGLAGAEGKERVQGLLERGEAYRTLGHYRDAEADFREALEGAKRAGEPLLEAVAMQSLGYLVFLQGDPARGETLLRSALEKAEALDRPSLVAVCANRLGDVLVGVDRREEALASYRKALELAEEAGDATQETTARLNLARVLRGEGAKEELRMARETAASVPSAGERAWLLLGIAAEARQIWTSDQGIGFAYDALKEAFSLATEAGSDRLLSLAAGRLGALYEDRGRRDEALRLTEQAIASAQRARAHDLLLQWEWQLGRILRAQGHKEKAVAAYRRAVYHIQAIRHDIPIRYQGGRSSFRETLAPIYFGLADMLLRQAAEEKDGAARQALLREARDTVERIKRSEIRDYFNDPCVDARTRQVESLSPATAVLYPVILDDRLEVLVDAGGRLYRETSRVTQSELERTAAVLARALRDPRRGSAYEGSAGEIFDWLIRPVLPVLEEHRVDTLVYVPDGALRLVPAAALWDGERFLVERYAVATVPGLSLLDPNPLSRGDLYAILAGVSQPGPVVLELPGKMWDTLSRSVPGDLERGVRGLTTVVEELEPSVPPKASGEQRQEAMALVQKALALPGVEQEIQRLSEDLRGRVLLDSEFQLESFSSDFRENDYRIVHIASHGFFGGAPEQNFIMTYDKLLNMSQLESLIKPRQLAERPVELIALSACQTAEGDDRSPLGLTGVALKSGARSGLGSLWPVSDAAAQELFPAFYGHLKDPRNTKALALRAAQLDVMKQEGFRHPFYWSPFILVGNWL